MPQEPKPITLKLTLSLEEWEQVVLPLADETLEAMRGRQMRIPKRISKVGRARLALGLPLSQWGNGDRLDGHRPHEQRKDKDQQ